LKVRDYSRRHRLTETAYALWQKWLAKGAFEFPKVIGRAAGVDVSATDLALFLGGVALNAKWRMRYTLAATTAAAN
jgi:hypothetical protein